MLGVAAAGVGQLGHDGLFLSHSVAGEAPYGAAMKRVRCDIQYSIHSISQANLCFVGEVLRCNKLEMRAQWQILAFFCCNARRVMLAPVDGFWDPGAGGRGWGGVGGFGG